MIGRILSAFCLVVALGTALASEGNASTPFTCQTGEAKDPIRSALMKAACALYNHRANEHYTQGSKRWNGITNKKTPPEAPDYSDCSSAASWVYWTVFGKDTDYLNGQDWKAGYTGTMTKNGVSISLKDAHHGDLVFYGGSKSVPEHVAIYAGKGMVISHGSDPVQHESVHYRSDIVDVRCYFHDKMVNKCGKSDDNFTSETKLRI